MKPHPPTAGCGVVFAAPGAVVAHVPAMCRVWTAIAVLAASWLPGLGYYHLADPPIWGAMVLVGALLMVGVRLPMPGRGAAWAAVALLAPVVAVWPWPYRAAPGLLMAGLVLWALPFPRDWPKRIGEALVAAGAVLLAQATAMYAYEAVTARSHELPWPLTSLLEAVGQLLGQDSALCETTLAVYSMREVHRLGATWELLLDPPTWCFAVGGVALLLLRAPWAPQVREAGAAQSRRAAGQAQGGRRGRYRAVLRAIGALGLSMLVWLPVRLALLLAVYVHRVLVTDYDAPLNVMNQFWSTPLLGALLAGPVLLAWRFVGRGPAEEPPGVSAAPVPAPGAAPAQWRPVVALVLVGLAAAVLTAAVVWESVGQRKPGRVLVDEGHTRWEPTTRAMDTEWYGHDSGYNYACLYDYCGRFYDMGRLTQPISAETLKNCDVLIVKTPTDAYKPDEVDAIARFVEAGGGLVLIGEHTNVFKTGDHINDLARRFGFAFRYDCLFGVDSCFEEHFEPPLAPHPIIQHMPPLDFSVSCSIAPGASAGRAVIRGVGLKNAMADFHASNFYPQARDYPDMRYGAFVQLWATRHGKGRVVAFTDSTIFSNFSMFEPAKPELLLGMLEWANYIGGAGNPRPWLVLLAVVLAAGGVWLARGGMPAAALLLAAAMLGHAAAAVVVREHHRAAMPPPRSLRPYVLVTIDRTVSDAILSKGGFIGGKEEGFGIFERWILRLGYFTKRAAGPEVTQGNAVVVFNPDLTVPREYVDTLVNYVKGGGHLLVLDSRKNAKSTANSLLWPFGLAVKHEANLAGQVAPPAGWPAVKVDAACEVSGGQPLVHLRDKPVAAWARYGEGTVAVIGFSARFCDQQMGVTGDVVPDAPLRQVYDFEFLLLRAIIQGALPGPAKSP